MTLTPVAESCYGTGCRDGGVLAGAPNKPSLGCEILVYNA